MMGVANTTICFQLYLLSKKAEGGFFLILWAEDKKASAYWSSEVAYFAASLSKEKAKCRKHPRDAQGSLEWDVEKNKKKVFWEKTFRAISKQLSDLYWS